MMTSSPALHTASNVEIMASVEPQQTVISRLGIDLHALPFAAYSARWRCAKFLAPQVMAY